MQYFDYIFSAFAITLAGMFILAVASHFNLNNTKKMLTEIIQSKDEDEKKN
ncbi:MAG: hypothetical protein VX086_06685 [Pseudomonadota bacterium]|nr:hypothetical protein [Pseudomonadota bacterium]